MKNVTSVFLLFLNLSLAAQPEVILDIPYSPENPGDTLRQLNLALPAESGGPLLIWIGGGAWSYVDKQVEMDLAKMFAANGIAVASIGHRLSPATWRDPALTSGVKHPAHVKDVAEAVSWLVSHASAYGYDPANIFIGGFSSGAHLALLVALDPSYLESVGIKTSIIKGVIPISGAYDIENYRDVLSAGEQPELAELHADAVFGSNKQDRINASPTNYLDNLKQPLLIISDNALYQYTRLLEERIAETEFSDFRVVYAYDLNHGGLWRDLSFNTESIYRKLMENFILLVSRNNGKKQG